MSLDDRSKEISKILSETGLSRMWSPSGGKKEIVQQKVKEELDYWQSLRQLETKKWTKKEVCKFILDEAFLISGVELDKFMKLSNDPEYISLIKDLAEWLNNKDSKDLLIWSAPGVGKTVLMKAIKKVSIRIKIEREEVNYYDFGQSLDCVRNGDKLDLTFGHNQNIIIDDLSERISDIVTYGTRYDISSIIEARYRIWKNTKKGTIITTNVFPHTTSKCDSLETMLTERAKDRIKEQYKIIYLTGKSKRHG